MRLGLLILAGGRSRRMGQDKASLPFPGPTDPPLIHRIARELAGVAGPPLIAGPHDYGTGWRLVADEPGLEGPVAGLLAGLGASGAALVLAVATDVPFPSARLASALAELAQADPGRDAVVPRRGGRLEPLFAVYRPRAVGRLREMARQLASPGRGPSLRQTLAAIRVREVAEAEWRAWDPAGASFESCNTPDELARARARAQPGQGGDP